MKRPVNPVLKVIVIEFSIIIALGVFLRVFYPVVEASVWLGGLIFFIPNTYFTLYAFRYSDAQWAPWILRSFYRGQAGKLILVGLGFAIVFKCISPIHHIALFGTFAFMNFVHILVAANISSEPSSSN